MKVVFFPKWGYNYVICICIVSISPRISLSFPSDEAVGEGRSQMYEGGTRTYTHTSLKQATVRSRDFLDRRDRGGKDQLPKKEKN